MKFITNSTKNFDNWLTWDPIKIWLPGISPLGISVVYNEIWH